MSHIEKKKINPKGYVDRILKSIEDKQGETGVYESAIELCPRHNMGGGYGFLYDFALAVLSDPLSEKLKREKTI